MSTFERDLLAQVREARQQLENGDEVYTKMALIHLDDAVIAFGEHWLAQREIIFSSESGQVQPTAEQVFDALVSFGGLPEQDRYMLLARHRLRNAVAHPKGKLKELLHISFDAYGQLVQDIVDHKKLREQTDRRQPAQKKTPAETSRKQPAMTTDPAPQPSAPRAARPPSELNNDVGKRPVQEPPPAAPTRRPTPVPRAARPPSELNNDVGKLPVQEPPRAAPARQPAPSQPAPAARRAAPVQPSVSQRPRPAAPEPPAPREIIPTRWLVILMVVIGVIFVIMLIRVMGGG